MILYSACIFWDGSNYCNKKYCKSSIDRPARLSSLRKYDLGDILLHNISTLVPSRLNNNERKTSWNSENT